MHLHTEGVFARAVVAFLALPGVIAFAVPIGWLLLAGRFAIAQPLGLAPLALGVVGLGWTVRDFYVNGKGTLAPWSPPTRLVTTGLYRWSRNPMYVAVALILLGWAAMAWYLPLLVSAVAVAVAFHVRVLVYEEPVLAELFGDAWHRYRARVPRWLGRAHPGSARPGGDA